MKRIVLLLLVLAAIAGLVWAQEPTPAPTPAPETPPPEKPALAKKIQLLSPIDGGPVEGWEIDQIITRGVDTDFCYLNASDSYYQKLIATDPRTGYTGYPGDFLPNLKQPLPADVIEKVRKKIPKQFDLQKLEPWDRYAIMAQIYIWRKMPEKEIANAYLRATYTMRGLELGESERKRERELRAEAIDYLIEAEEKAQFPLSEAPQVKYLIGELYRRNGKFSKAIRYFEDAVKMKNRPEWLEEMILRQKAHAYAHDDR